MKTTLRISIGLNLVLLAGFAFVLTGQRKEANAAAPASFRVKPAVPSAAALASRSRLRAEPAPFRWSQLESSKNYRTYIANLRAIGCPEATIEDIVRGDVERTYSWERHQLGLEGSGVGPWSWQAETKLVASLLGEQLEVAQTSTVAQGSEIQMGDNGGNEASRTPVLTQSAANQTLQNAGGEVAQASVPSQNAAGAPPSYPLFLQNVNWSALGFNADQQAAIAQVRQQFLSQVNSPNQNANGSADPSVSPVNSNPNDSTSQTPWQKAVKIADGQLQSLLGYQGYEDYVQQEYKNWFQPQIVAANAEGQPLAINPDAFSVK